MADNQIGLIKESYPLIKEICGDVYEALSLVFPQLPAYVTARRAECLVAACKATQEKLKSAGITRESQVRMGVARRRFFTKRFMGKLAGQ